MFCQRDSSCVLHFLLCYTNPHRLDCYHNQYYIFSFTDVTAFHHNDSDVIENTITVIIIIMMKHLRFIELRLWWFVLVARWSLKTFHKCVLLPHEPDQVGDRHSTNTFLPTRPTYAKLLVVAVSEFACQASTFDASSSPLHRLQTAFEI